MYIKIVINKGESKEIVDLKCSIEICIQGREARRVLVWPTDRAWLSNENVEVLKEESLIVLKSAIKEDCYKPVWFDCLNQELGFFVILTYKPIQKRHKEHFKRIKN